MTTFPARLLAAWKKKAAPALVNKAGDAASLYLYDVIGADTLYGGIAAKDVVDALQSAQGSKTLTVYVNSPGGDFFEGKAIYSALSRFAEKHDVTAVVDGLAASAASLICMAAPRVLMGADASMMVHEVQGGAFGRSTDLRSMAEVMDTENANLSAIYERRTGLPKDRIAELLAAETHMNAADAIRLGFADGIEGQDAPAREVKNTVPKFLALAETTQRRITESRLAIAKMDVAILKQSIRK